MLFIYFLSFYLSWPVISRINSNAAPLEVSFGQWAAAGAGAGAGSGGVSFLFILAALYAFRYPLHIKRFRMGIIGNKRHIKLSINIEIKC